MPRHRMAAIALQQLAAAETIFGSLLAGLPGC
jgi:hypothetical protein